MMDKSRGCVIRICSYNLLSQSLCKPESYYRSKPEDCHPQARYKRITSQLQAEVDQGSVLALQEVSETWAARLAVFFTQRDYQFFYRCYGGHFADYMGVGIAFPMKKYAMEDMATKRIADWGRWPRKPREEAGMMTSISSIAKRVRASVFGEVKDSDPYRLARRRFNVAMWMKLKDLESDKEICIGNYHMPCVFWAPPVMLFHTTLLFNFLQKLSKTTPLIVAGDYNFQPDSSSYELVTKGSLSKDHEDYPQPPVFDNAFDMMEKHPITRMNSAYKLFNGREPEMTNYSWVKPFNDSMKDEPFSGCLDFLFLSPEQFEVVDVRELPSLEQCGGPFPTEKEPSDHLMIRATLKL